MPLDIATAATPPDHPAPQPAHVAAYAPPESSADRLARQIIESRDGGQGAPLQPMMISRELSPASTKARKVSAAASERTVAPSYAGQSAGAVDVQLPPHIPSQCVMNSASAYHLNPMVLLAILKVESGGRTGIVSRNANGTDDLGPAQFNTGTWAKKLQTKYNISRDALINDMCQAVRAMAFAVRTEINDAGGDMWRGIGNYHSRTPKFHQAYVGRVLNAHISMVKKGKF